MTTPLIFACVGIGFCLAAIVISSKNLRTARNYMRAAKDIEEWAIGYFETLENPPIRYFLRCLPGKVRVMAQFVNQDRLSSIVCVKEFDNGDDEAFAMLQANELLDKLNEKQDS